MGLMRWMRGGDDNSATANALGAGMAEIGALFRPSKHKQTEYIHESRRRRSDIGSGAGSGVDLEMGIAGGRRPERGDVAAVPDDSDDLTPAATDGASTATIRRRRARITRRGGASPARLTVSAAALESEDSADA